MDWFPITLKVKDRPCLIVGGGEVAARKVHLLLESQAHIIVVAPTLCRTLNEALEQNQITHHARSFSPKDINNIVLVIAATDDEKINQQVARIATALYIPVNVVDCPDLCTFTVPSIVRRDPVLIAVSTGGASPVLARLLRARLETMIPTVYGKLAGLLGAFREQVKTRFSDAALRRRFWEQALSGPIAELVFSGREEQARQALQAELDNKEIELTTTGEVYLVGAGPGDPDLVTFRALRLMQQADIVLYDRLVSSEILDLVRRDAERIYVGKHRANHAMQQGEINQTLVDLAKEGKRVLRLKGGDPFIFGRGGEEIALLAENNVTFQVVPGITAASGCATYAGIPLTHRDHAQSVTFVAGQLKDGSINLNWSVLAQPQQTVVIYMGLKGVDIICKALQAHGAPATRPAALIEQGTTSKQRVLEGTLANLADIVSQSDVHAPTLIIVGDVVKLHNQLAWFRVVS